MKVIDSQNDFGGKTYELASSEGKSLLPRLNTGDVIVQDGRKSYVFICNHCKATNYANRYANPFFCASCTREVEES